MAPRILKESLLHAHLCYSERMDFCMPVGGEVVPFV